jgi:hypothetical protein
MNIVQDPRCCVLLQVSCCIILIHCCNNRIRHLLLPASPLQQPQLACACFSAYGSLQLLLSPQHTALVSLHDLAFTQQCCCSCSRHVTVDTSLSAVAYKCSDVTAPAHLCLLLCPRQPTGQCEGLPGCCCHLRTQRWCHCTRLLLHSDAAAAAAHKLLDAHLRHLLHTSS